MKRIPREIWLQYLMALILLGFYLDGFTTKVLGTFQLDFYGFVTALSGLGIMPGAKMKAHRIFPVVLFVGGSVMTVIGLIIEFQKAL